MFPDDAGKLNRSLLDVDGAVLLGSLFDDGPVTLWLDTGTL